jgi:hypothetical protein
VQEVADRGVAAARGAASNSEAPSRVFESFGGSGATSVRIEATIYGYVVRAQIYLCLQNCRYPPQLYKAKH